MEIQGVFQSLPNDSLNKRRSSLFGKTTKVLAALKEFMFLSVEKCEGEERISLLNPKTGEILQSVLLCDHKNKGHDFVSNLSGFSPDGHAGFDLRGETSDLHTSVTHFGS